MANLIKVGGTDCPTFKILMTLKPSFSVLHENWSALAATLGTPSEKIKSIRNDMLVNKLVLWDALQEVLEGWVGRKGESALLTELINKLDENDLRSCGNSLRLEFSLPWPDPNQPTWNDLTPSFRQKVETNVAQFWPDIQLNEDLKTALSGHALSDIMAGRKPSLLNDLIPKQLSYYVERTLITRNILTEEIFYYPSEDIFLLTGMERNELDRRVKKAQLSSSSNQPDNWDAGVRYMIMDQPNPFDKINPHSTTPVHHINVEGGTLYWIKSRGSVDKLQHFVAKPQSQQHLNETEFLDKICQSSKTNRPVCISDSPGMGKSVILLQIGGNLKKRFPERTIIFQEFANLIDSYKKKQKSIELVLKTLTCKDNKLGERIFTSKLASKDLTIELLLDGYDELSSVSFKTAKEILETLRSKFRSIRVWITTRPHLLKRLENILHVFGYNIEPFSPEDQVKFLASYWSRPDNDQALSMPMSTIQESRLTDYATHCLNYIKSALPSKDQDIAGIPLQCRMIGEVYEEEALEYSREESSFSGIKILISSITDLYERTIKNRLGKYQSTKYTKLKLGNDDLKNMHAYLGIQLVFPEHLATLKPYFRDVEHGDMESVGSKCEAKFSHRTFAEYFIAWFAVNALNSAGSSGGILEANLQTFLFNGILKCKGKEAPYNYEFEYPVVCFFLNSLLPLNNKTEADSIPPTVGNFSAIAWACAYNDFPKIFMLLDGWTVFKDQEEEIFNSDFLLTTVQKSNLELITIAVARLGREKWDLGLQTKVLRSAVERGVFSNVAFLLQHNDTYKILEEGPSRESMQILHCCVENSKDDTDETIREKVKVLKHLININKELLEEEDEKGNTPLVCGNVHPELVNTLISLGADVLAKNNLNDTILHFNYFTPIEYHSILTTLQTVQKEKLTELVNSVGYDSYTPLWMLMRTMDPEEGTLATFKSAGADFNVEKSFKDQTRIYNYSLLALAVKEGRNNATIEELISCGADINWKGPEGESLLHVAAVHLRLEVVSMLIDKGFDINIHDKELRTPLHWAAGGAYKTDNFNIIKSLIQLGADVNKKDQRGNLFLHDLLLKNHNLTLAQLNDIAEFLVENIDSKCFEMENNEGVTPFEVLKISGLKIIDTMGGTHSHKLHWSATEEDQSQQPSSSKSLPIKTLIKTEKHDVTQEEYDDEQIMIKISDDRIPSVFQVTCQSPFIRRAWKEFAEALGLSTKIIANLGQELSDGKINHVEVVQQVFNLWTGDGDEPKLSDKTINLRTLIKATEKVCGDYLTGDYLRLMFNLRCFGANSRNLCWGDLSPAFQNRVKETIINIISHGTKNEPANYDEILLKLYGITWNKLFSEVQQNVLADLSIGKIPDYNFKNKLPQLERDYDVFVEPRHTLAPDKLFGENCSDIFVFTGLERHELSILAKQMTSSTSSQLELGLSVRFMILDEPYHFEKICKMAKPQKIPVHLVNYRDKKFEWERSQGEIKHLTKMRSVVLGSSYLDLDETH